MRNKITPINIVFGIITLMSLISPAQAHPPNNDSNGHPVIKTQKRLRDSSQKPDRHYRPLIKKDVKVNRRRRQLSSPTTRTTTQAGQTISTKQIEQQFKPNPTQDRLDI